MSSSPLGDPFDADQSLTHSCSGSGCAHHSHNDTEDVPESMESITDRVVESAVVRAILAATMLPDGTS